MIHALISSSTAPSKLKKTNSGLTRVASSGGGQNIGGTGHTAKAIGAVCRAAGPAVGNKTCGDLMKLGQSIFTLTAIGEVAVDGVGEVAGLQEMLTSCLKEGEEADLFAAAFTVGCLCVGNPQKYIPYVVSQLGSGTVNKVVMLTAVKEAVTRCVDLGKTELLMPHVQSSILPLLVSLASSDNEAARQKVEDCLGKLLKMAPAEVMDTISSSSSGGDASTRALSYNCLLYYTNTDDGTDDLVLPGAITMLSQGVGDAEPTVRVAAVRAVNSLLHKPKHFRAAADAVIDKTFDGILTETRYSNVVKETMGSITIETDLGLDNREAAFLCLTQAMEHLEDKLPMAAIMEAAAMGCSDAGIPARCAALKITQAIATTSASMLSEHILGLKNAVCAALKGSRVIRKESEADFSLVRNFIMGLRDIFGSFKEIEPTHPVHDELEAGLQKQRNEWEKSKVPATRELVFLIDEFNGIVPAADHDGASGEQ